MTTTIIIQVLSLLYTLFSIEQEHPINKLFIDNIKPHTKESKQYHDYGAGMTCLFCMSVALSGTNLIMKAAYFFLAAFIYWLVFDMWITPGNPFYLGDESGVDATLKKLFGKKYAGGIKALFCVAAIITINLLIFNHII